MFNIDGRDPSSEHIENIRLFGSELNYFIFYLQLCVFRFEHIYLEIFAQTLQFVFYLFHKQYTGIPPVTMCSIFLI